MTTTPVSTTSSSLTVSSGNELDVLNGGSVSAITVLSGGLLMVEAGGVDTGATISAAGSETVIGSASGDQIFGSVNVSGTNAVVTNDTVQNGGTLGLNLAGVVAMGATVNAGGTLAINGRASAVNTTLNGGTISLLSPKATLSGTVTFTAPSTIVVSTVTSAPSSSAYGDQAVLSGFAKGDVIDDKVLAGGTLTYLVGSSTTEVNLTGTSGTTTILESFVFAGAAPDLRAIADGTGGTEIVVACFCEGTRIRTDAGEVAVEQLAVGDRVVTVDGMIEPIRWIGRRTYSGRQLAGRRHLLPVRIKAGALADDTPKRDLLVSPLHAMLIDGVLVPAHALVNGTTIVQEMSTETVRYVHIELAQHEAVWAEGAASETFVDDDGRFVFQSSEGVAVSKPDHAIYCAPRVVTGHVLETIRRRLGQRALQMAEAS